jgi:hypothetical protein
MTKMIRYFSQEKGEHVECRKSSKKAKELHTCPYRVDVEGDDSLCDCDKQREIDCAHDI